MTRRTLEQLLHDADASSEAPAARGALAARVHERRNRQRRARLAAGAVAAVLVLVVSVAMKMSMDPARERVVPIAVKPPEAAVEPNELHWVARFHEETADRLLASAEKRARQLSTASPAPRVASAAAPTAVAPDDVRFQRDRAALILVYEADRHARESRPAAAVASYRRAIELFPQTHWADIARQRLKQM